MNYAQEFRKFITSQYIYSGVRITLAIVIPSIILAYFGLLKDYFLFPLGTSFVGLTDMAGPYIRRRNALLFAIISFIIVATVASILKDFPPVIFLEIIAFGIFFSMIGIYGQRMAAVGGISLVVLSIFIDGHLTGTDILKSLLIFLAGCIWFFLIFLVVSKIQPYKLAAQLIGENYIQLAEYLRIKAKFYQQDANLDELYLEVINKQIILKNLQEDTREVVFKTRTLVNESTTYSRLLMLMFLNSIDFFEKLFTSDQDYRKLHDTFGEKEILNEIHEYLLKLSQEISSIGIALQSGQRAVPLFDIPAEFYKVYNSYFALRNRQLSSQNLESFMTLRMALVRIQAVTEDVRTMYKVFTQDTTLAKSLSTGLDFEKFVPQQEKLNFKVLLTNISLKSAQFRHAVRITSALLIGYAISKLSFLGIGHSYWILITIIAIMRPAYSTTKHRNLLRLYGTLAGGILAYLILQTIQNEAVLLGILLSSMILCFALLKDKYALAVFFMTLYIFVTFNFLNPGNVNLLFKDRILDTAIAGIIAFIISYFVLPVWEHTQNSTLMQRSATANLEYFKAVMEKLENPSFEIEAYKVKRKDAMISLANLSDNFQRMLSDPKNQQKNLETVHQFVTTAHLTTAYTASLSQYTAVQNFTEIDLKGWAFKISNELAQTAAILRKEKIHLDQKVDKEPEDVVDELLEQRKTEINENEYFDNRDPQRITKLTQLKNIRELLELLYDVVHEQKNSISKYEF